MYAVIWMAVALDELADAFVRADLSRRDSLERAILRLNAQLAADPTHLGESRSGNERVAFDQSCVITFRVDSPIAGVVRVTHFRSW